MSDTRLKIIHIMNHPPAYEKYSDKQRPEINWDTHDGSWVGIWGLEWADLLSIEVRKINSVFEHEIWQPDLCADEIYSKEIFPGVIHRLFPACVKRKFIGLRKSREFVSQPMIQFSHSKNTNDVIFHIGQSVTCKINKDLFKYCTNAPFVFSFHGQIALPNVSLLKFQKNFLAKFHYLKEHILAKILFKRISFLTYQSNKNLNYLKSYYQGPIKKVTMGIHFDKYLGYDKIKCRRLLNLPLEKKILLTVCRLYDLKQVDKLIEILTAIESDFLYIIVGYGEKKYEEYLHNKARKLKENNKIIFTEYKTGQELIEYFNSSDLFIHVSSSEAGPVAIMEAMACELPIFCTDTGNTAELLRKYDAGLIVEINNYKDWSDKLIDYLSGEPIKTLALDVVKEHYDWGNIAAKFIRIYDYVINDKKQ